MSGFSGPCAYQSKVKVFVDRHAREALEQHLDVLLLADRLEELRAEARPDAGVAEVLAASSCGAACTSCSVRCVSSLSASARYANVRVRLEIR